MAHAAPVELNVTPERVKVIFEIEPVSEAGPWTFTTTPF
jgi:hypothetical protein